jgi:predicted transcriptional regulator
MRPNPLTSQLGSPRPARGAAALKLYVPQGFGLPDAAVTLGSSAAEVLLLLCRFTVPLSAREVARRLNLPRSTAFYALKRLLEQGLVARRGKAKSMGAVYEPTPLGRRAAALLKSKKALHDLERVQTTFRTTAKGFVVSPVSYSSSAFGGRRGLRVALCVERRPGVWVPVRAPVSVGRLGVGLEVPVWVVVDGDPSGSGKVELGFRMPWAPVRRYLSLLGARFSSRARVRAATVYAREGVVHVDFAVPRRVLRALGAEVREVGHAALMRQALALFVLAALAASASGWSPELLAAVALAARGSPA